MPKREREQGNEEVPVQPQVEPQQPAAAAAADGGKGKGKRPEPARHPRKSFFRARAHSNPFNDSSFEVPVTPEAYDWSRHFPERCSAPGEASTSGRAEPGAEQLVRFADVGCGFGGLLIKLSPLYPDTLMVGMEIRDKVAAYVQERIGCLRRDNPGQFQNVSVLRNNAMKNLPNFFRKGQLTKLFFLFPDPHFKVANHRRRIIQPCLLTEYAYLMAPGGWLYTITDVPELGDWMVRQALGWAGLAMAWRDAWWSVLGAKMPVLRWCGVTLVCGACVVRDRSSRAEPAAAAAWAG